MDILIRIACIYLFILIGLRIVGKREFGQLSPHELVTLLIIPEIVSPALTKQDTSLTGALIGTSTLLLLVFLTSVLSHRFRKVERWVSGQPVLLVENGKLLDQQLNLSRVSPEEVFSEMRKAGIDDLERVKWAVLESDGKISFLEKKSEESATGLSANERENVVG